MNKKPTQKVLSVFSLVMINIIAVDSLRSLPMAAEYGFSLVFYYLLAALVFFIPIALVAAELATGWPEKGGVYVWIREAFGAKWAFFIIWIQWIYNVVWFPTIMAFLGGMIAYLFAPKLAANPYFMLCVILVLFWLATLINSFGMKASSFMSTLGALIGTIFPMVFISVLGVIWLTQGHHSEIKFTTQTFFPDLSSIRNFAFLVGVVFGLIGIEMSAVHAEEVKNPQRDYPKALFWSTIIILMSFIFSALAIADVVPHGKINLVTGVMQAFSVFFSNLHMPFLMPVLAILIFIGGLSGVSAWIIGPTKGLLVASEDGSIPPIFKKVNRYGVPIVLLITQAVIVTILSAVFLFMPSVNASYWILSALTAQLALIFYLGLFAAVVKLRYSKPHKHRTYKIPGGKLVLWLVAGIGSVTCIAVILFGFLPPANLQIGSILGYESFLVIGCLLFCLIPFVIYRFKKDSWN